MADSTLSTMDAVAALMQERAKYEGWLAALESRRATTPARVYDRVSGDYRGRLDHVLTDIAGRASELEAVSAGLRSRVKALEADEETRLEERAEAEVRAAVGEYSAEQWDELRSVADAEIAHVTAQLAEQRAELERVDGILTIARGPRRGEASSAEPEAARVEAPSEPAWEPAREPVREAPREPSRWAAEAVPSPYDRPYDSSASGSGSTTGSGGGAARVESAPAPEASVIIPFTVEGESRDAVARGDATREGAGREGGPRDSEGSGRRPVVEQPWSDQGGNDSSFDDLAFLKSIVEPTVPSASSPSPAPSPTSSARPVPRGDESRLSTPGRGLAALRSLLGTDDKSAAPAGGTPAGRSAAGGREDQRQSASGRDDATSGGAKTLRCGECGTLNYPTEWYCERCGGELAAM